MSTACLQKHFKTKGKTSNKQLQDSCGAQQSGMQDMERNGLYNQ